MDTARPTAGRFGCLHNSRLLRYAGVTNQDPMTRTQRLTISLVIIAAAAVFPVIVWLTMKPLALRFGTWYAAARSLGQLTALVGLVLFAVTQILSARLLVFDRWFAGLDKMYAKHHQLGIWAFWLLLVHPLALAAGYFHYGLKEAVAFLLPWSTVPWAAVGMVGFGLMALLLLITLFARIMRYDWWKWSHRLLGAAFIIGLVHAMMIDSDTTASVLLKSYVAALGLLATLAWGYRSVFGSALVRRWPYLVEAVTDLGSGNWSVVLKPRARAMPFAAGQFAYLKFGGRGVSGEEHPFSMASGTADANLIFGIRALGDWTRRIGSVKPGTPVRVEGPFGAFTPWRGYGRRQVWIAGGIGITPFLSAAASWPTDGPAPYVDLFYCVRDEPSASFLKSVQGVTPATGSFRLHLMCENIVGRLRAESVVQATEEYQRCDYFLCGPPPMMGALTVQLISLGVPEAQIHFERFTLNP